jgi:uncharacterized protein (DUF488 family)
MDSNPLFTIGHSNHTFKSFLDIMQPHGIQHVVDVRSQPYSRRFPQFNIKELKARLPQAGIEYTFLGDHLGGRPKNPDFYDDNGELVVERLVASSDFLDGLDRLIEIAVAAPTAVMCSEEDPGRCHRGTMLTPALESRGFQVRHIRKPTPSVRTGKHDQLVLKM